MLYPMTPWIYPAERYYYGWYAGEPEEFEPTDQEIKSTIVDRLRENPHTADDDIKVDVTEKVVILSGDISSALAKRAAGDDAWDTRGVADVSNQLKLAGETG